VPDVHRLQRPVAGDVGLDPDRDRRGGAQSAAAALQRRRREGCAVASSCTDT
jgi:hypothetical protein